MNLSPRFPEVTPALLERECARELEARRSLYPRLVEGGRMTAADADRKIAIAEAWLTDARRLAQPFADRDPAPPASSSAAIGRQNVFWHHRRAELLDELGQRARLYPKWIEGGRLLKADADQRNACMECLLARYENGWDFTLAGARPRLWSHTEQRAPAERDAAIAWLQLQLEIAARRADAARRDNALKWLDLEGVKPEPTVQQEIAFA